MCTYMYLYLEVRNVKFLETFAYVLYAYDPKYIIYVLVYCFEQKYMHGMPLYEWCIIILLYTPTIIITIIVDFI